MKKTVFIAVISALCFSSCSKDDEPQKVNLEIAIAPPDNSDHAIINFRCTGDFELTPFSRTRSLEADGKAMTDLWVLDYIVPIGSIGTIKTMTLAQTIHQTTADADFGSPTLDLAAGDHVVGLAPALLHLWHDDNGRMFSLEGRVCQPDHHSR